MSASIEVKWGARRFTLDFDGQDQIDALTVAELKQRCQQLTEIDPKQMKLLAYGAIMKNDEALVSQYDIRAGSKILLMGAPPKPQQNKTTLDEGAVVYRVQEIEKKINTVIVPGVDDYEQRVKTFVVTPDKTAQQLKKLVEEGMSLSEQLMQVLFDLDGVTCAPEFNAARQARKANVQRAQVLLDRVDKIKGSLK